MIERRSSEEDTHSMIRAWKELSKRSSMSGCPSGSLLLWGRKKNGSLVEELDKTIVTNETVQKLDRPLNPSWTTHFILKRDGAKTSPRFLADIWLMARLSAINLRWCMRKERVVRWLGFILSTTVINAATISVFLLSLSDSVNPWKLLAVLINDRYNEDIKRGSGRERKYSFSTLVRSLIWAPLMSTKVGPSSNALTSFLILPVWPLTR